MSRRVRSTVVDESDALTLPSKSVVTRKSFSDLPKVHADAEGTPFPPLAPWLGGLENPNAADTPGVVTRMLVYEQL